MRNDRISSGFSVKILSNDVIHHIHVFMVIKNIMQICIYMQIFLLYFIVFILMYSIVLIGFCFCVF